MALVNHVSGSLFDETNLLAYYKLEDVNDSGLSGYTLTNVNTATFVAGKYSNCVNLVKTSSQSLSVANNGGIDGGACTISQWVNLTTQPAEGVYFCFFIQNNNTSDVGNIIYYYISGGVNTLWFLRNKSGVGSQGPTPAYTLTAGAWYNVVYVYDGTNIYGYVNGALVGGPTAATGSGTGTSGNIIAIGADANPGTWHTNGKIDETLLFNRAWSAQEVYNYYQQYKSAMQMGSNY